LAIVDVISAPSNDRFKDFTLSISKLIYSTFLVDIEGVFSTPFNNLTNVSRFDTSPFFMVGLEDAGSIFFLKSTLRSLRDEEYLVFAYLI
jgi:hypothetical protein